MARNYQQAKIYCIKVNTDDMYLPYVGSSCKRLLSQRMNQHRQHFKQWKNGKYHFVSSFTLFEKFGIENCYIELIELFPCNCNDELRKKEREHIEKIECVNIVKRVIVTKEEFVEHKKKYRDIHKEYFAEKDKEWYEANKEKIKEWYEANREQIAKKRKETYECPCGSTLRKSDKSQHELTKKHQKYLTTISTHATITESS